MRVFVYALLSVAVSLASLYVDWGSSSFTWFQRSGAFVVLAGAILSYRSIVRLGVRGVGGAPSSALSIVKVLDSYEDEETGRRMLKVKRSPEDVEHELQIALDQVAGYLGALLAIAGTIICGYGDLLAKI